jgi:predicted flap endonuclease-1-like 5' DNA nuclease
VTSLPHLFDTALLLAVAYLVGCFLGTGLRQLVKLAGRGTIAESERVAAHRGPAERLMLATSAAPLLALPSPLALSPPAALVVSEPPNFVEPPMALMDAALSASSRPVATIITLPRRDASADPSEIAAIGRPPGLPSPRNGAPDDLQRIKGIGPRLAASLNALGIFHFDQIARWNEMNLAWIEAQPHLSGRATRDKWIAQAAALAGHAPPAHSVGAPMARPASASARSV